MLTLAKLKVAAAVALVITAIAGATVTPLIHYGAPQTVVATSTLAVSQPGAGGAQADPNPPVTVQVTPEVKLEFLGLSPFPGDEESWFSIAGEPIDMPEVPGEQNMRANVEPDYQMLIRVTAPEGVVVMPRIEGTRIAMASHARSDDGNYVLTSRFSLEGPADTMSMNIGVSGAKWTPIATTEKPQEESEADAGENGAMTFAPAEPDPDGDGALVSVSHQPLEFPARAVAFDDAGKQHESQKVNVRRSNDDVVSNYTFALPAEQIRKVEVQVRGFDQFVEVKDVSLTQGQKTEPKIVITDAKKDR